MKVFATTLAAFAIGQDSSDKWTGFDYDYGFGDNTNLDRNQVSQSAVGNTLLAQDPDNNASPPLDSDGLQEAFNFHTDSPVLNGYTGLRLANMELGNGRMCWFCDSDSVYNCFKFGKFQTCRGQDYFCFYHERRRIGHYFNRREKYIDNDQSKNTDLFLVRTNNEAWNLDMYGMPNSKDGKRTATGIGMGTDNFRPATDIHVLAGCQQPEACLRQQSQNQALNMGIAFYGDNADTEVNGHQSPGVPGVGFQTYIPPTSRRNVREGLCRIGRDWTYYSGKLWHYDNQGEKDGDAYVETIPDINNTPIDTTDTSLGLVDTNPLPYKSTGVFGRSSSGDPVSSLLWGRGIYDAHDSHGHQFWHERESWYNGMRPNGFPEQHYHGGKGTESVCHFCCNPASTDGMFCNRRRLDGSDPAETGGTAFGFEFNDESGPWLQLDQEPQGDAGDARNKFVDNDYVRADNPNLLLVNSPMVNSFYTGAAWLSKHRYHGMFRNPNTQVSQDFLDPYFSK